MGNVRILADAPSEAGVFTGGKWVASLPLTNLLTQQPKQVARSLDTATASTRFICDLGGIRPVGSFALIGSNLTAASTVQIRVSDSADGSAAALNVKVPGFPPNVAFGSLPWGQFPWDGYRDDPLPAGQVTYYEAPSAVLGRYVLIDIADTGNPAGYVQVGRFMAGAAFVPRFNFTPGAAFGFIDPSKVTVSVGGQKWFDKRPKTRKLRLSFDAATQAEAYGVVYDFQRRLGITGNMLVIYDPDDTPDVILRRTIYGSMPQLDDVVTANTSIDAPYTWSLSIEELI